MDSVTITGSIRDMGSRVQDPGCKVNGQWCISWVGLGLDFSFRVRIKV